MTQLRQNANEPGSHGAKDGMLVDRYFLHVYTSDGETQLLIDIASRMYRMRWRRHWLQKTPDIDLLALAARRAFDW